MSSGFTLWWCHTFLNPFSQPHGKCFKPLQFKVSCQQFNRLLFCNGAPWRKCFQAAREFFVAIPHVATGQDCGQYWAVLPCLGSIKMFGHFTVPPEKTRSCDRIIQRIRSQSPHIYAPHFFKDTALSLHKSANCAKYAGLAWFHNPRIFVTKKVPYIFAESWELLRLLHTRAIFLLLPWERCEVTSSESCKPREEDMMKSANHSHLPTKVSAKDWAKYFLGVLHDSGGRLFWTRGNCVLDHRRKSTLDSHFATAKHSRMVTAAAEAAHLHRGGNFQNTC